MKVFLEAFGGKLFSNPIDFPDEVVHMGEIHLMLDLDVLSTSFNDDFKDYETKVSKTIPKRGRFRRRSGGYVVDGKVYDSFILVGID